MTAVRPIKKVKVFSPNPEHRKSFVEEMSSETGIQGGPVGDVTPERAPVKEVVLTGEKADLCILPMPMRRAKKNTPQTKLVLNWLPSRLVVS